MIIYVELFVYRIVYTLAKDLICLKAEGVYFYQRVLCDVRISPQLLVCVCVSAKTHKNKSLQEKNQEKDDDT